MNSIIRLRPLSALSPSVLCALLGLAAPGGAQDDIASDLSHLAPENAQPYMQPLAKGLAWAMASGVLDGAEPLGRMEFEVGARVSAALPPDEANTFEAVLPESIVWGAPSGERFDNPYRVQGGERRGPTVVGEGSGVVLEPDGPFREAILASGGNPSDLTLSLPRGRDFPAVPYPVFHASLGVGLGTDLSARFIPEVTIDEEAGNIQGFGFTVRHAITNWLAAPIDLSLMYANQMVDVGTYLEASSSAYGVVAGRRMGPLSLFASGLVRSGTVDVTYEVDNSGEANPALPEDGTAIRFSEELEATTAFGVGARLQLLIMNLAGEYTFGDYPVVSLKVGFGTP